MGMFIWGKTQPSLICLLVEEWHQNSHCLPGSSSCRGTNYGDSKSEVYLKKKKKIEKNNYKVLCRISCKVTKTHIRA